MIRTGEDDAKALTLDALLHPEVGDHFHEMFSFHAFVLYVDPAGGPVVCLTASAPCVVPDEGEVRVFDCLADYVDWATYDSPHLSHKSWMRLWERGDNVEGWLDAIYEAPRQAELEERH